MQSGNPDGAILDENKEATHIVFFRPFMIKFLEAIKGKFELILCCSSIHRDHLKKVMALIESRGHKFFSKILPREVCSKRCRLNDTWCKDLNVLTQGEERKMQYILLLDSNLESNVMNFNNLLPIPPYKGNKTDAFLFYLKFYLVSIAESDDLPGQIKKDTL